MTEDNEFIDWNEVFADPEYWLAFYWLNGSGDAVWKRYFGISVDDTDYLGQEGFPIQIACPGGFTLVFESPPSFYDDNLYLTHGVREQPLRLGYWDAHFFPYALRWLERCAIIERVTHFWAADFDAKYFPLLIDRFTSYTPRDPLDEIRNEIRANWEAVGLFDGGTIDRLLTKWPHIDDEIEWYTDPSRGWIARKGYSLRNKENDEFDFQFLASFFSIIGVVDQT